MAKVVPINKKERKLWKKWKDKVSQNSNGGVS